MASCALLLSPSCCCSSSSSPAFPLQSSRSTPAHSPSPARLFASSRAAVPTLAVALQSGVSPRARRARGVVCEVAVELGGSQRSSEGEDTSGPKVEAGTRIRVLGHLKVFHVPKHPELDIGGFEGNVKDVVTTFKGRPVSATFPFKVQLMTPGEEGRKFFVHLKEDEFEVVQD